MRDFLDRTTLLVITSALVVSILTLWPVSVRIFPLWIFSAGMQIANTLFHEMGHTVASWLFGMPAIPMIFTLFGADQAGGMTLAYEHSWIVQGMVWAALAWWNYRLWDTRWQGPIVLVSAISIGFAFTHYPDIIIAYMGHGGSILVGGFFLYRGWLNLDARNLYERWLNAFFGFFLVLDNAYFSYNLAFDVDARGAYNDHVAFGITHNDFAVIADLAPWSVRGIGAFTIAVCAVVMVAAFGFALRAYKQDNL